VLYHAYRAMRQISDCQQIQLIFDDVCRYYYTISCLFYLFQCHWMVHLMLVNTVTSRHVNCGVNRFVSTANANDIR